MSKAFLNVTVYCPGNCGSVMETQGDHVVCTNPKCAEGGKFYLRPSVELVWPGPTPKADPRRQVPKRPQEKRPL